MKLFSYHTVISSENLDFFGHVNNAEYLKLFEEARWKLILESEISQKIVIEEQIGPVLLNLNLSFKRELVLDDQIEIKLTDVYKKNKLVFILKQEILKENQIASQLEVTIGIMDLKTRKLIEPPLKWPKALGL